MTGTRAQSGENKKFAVCTGTQNDQIAGTSSRHRSWNFVRPSIARPPWYGVFVDERRVTEERGGLVTVLTLAVRELLGGFQLLALERLVNEDLGGIDQ